MLLGIDTEFVAHSPPDKVMRGCESSVPNADAIHLALA